MDAAIQEQIRRRQERARLENFDVKRVGEGTAKVITDFEVGSSSGRSYRVTIRSVTEPANGCTCPDFRTNLLGTCKHVEAVLEHLRRRHRKRLGAVAEQEAPGCRIFLSGRRELELRYTPVQPFPGTLGNLLARFFDGEGVLLGDPLERFTLLETELERLTPAARRSVVVEAEVAGELVETRERRGRQQRKDWFLQEVSQGRRSLDLISAKLYPYQAEGTMHLALTERAMLADDMGLGKTVQAIAAATLLRELRGIQRVLVITPASLKHQWEREIGRFTSLSTHVIQSIASRRDLLYATPAFFTIVNYELLLREREIFHKLAPELVILDEAQRIKNWRTKTAQAVKELRSRYAFVLSGTPLENNIDELYSVMQFLDPRILGPLWRFNQEFFILERKKSGHYKVLGNRNLGVLRERISPVVMRRTRDEVIQDLPDRVDNNFFVELTRAQAEPYADYAKMVKGLLQVAERRALTPDETKRLFMGLQKMRILCDALALHDRRLKPADVLATAPKLGELAKILEEQVLDAGRKAILFSSFEGMIDLVAKHVLPPLKLGFEKLAGSVPTAKRGKLLERFRADEACRLLLSTDAGGVGLNLQEASLVVNLDIPWNPAVLEQRIGRAHRMGQKRSVQVVNLITRGALEERMLDTLQAKRALFAAIFDGASEIDELRRDKAQALLARVRAMLEPLAPAVVEAELVQPLQLPGEPAAAAALPAPSESALALPGPVEPASVVEPGPGARPEGAAPTAGLTVPDHATALRTLAAALADRMAGRLLMLREWQRPGDGGLGLLAVVPDGTAAEASELEGLLAEMWRGRTPPPVHVLEQTAYRSLVGLLGVQLEDPKQEAWRSPALPRTLPPAEDPRLAQARKALEGASERLRLARLLAANGFAADAFAPLGEALDRGVEGLLARHAPPEHAQRLDLATVERFLVRPGHLTSDTSARIGWVRGLGQAPDLVEPALSAVEEILARAREVVAASAGG